MKNWISNYLTTQQIQKISQNIAEAEAKTTGEIVPVIVKSSTSTRHLPMLMSFIFLTFLLFESPAFINPLFSGVWIFIWPSLYCVLYFIFRWAMRFHFLQRLFLSHAEMNEQVFQRAQLEFYRQSITQTAQRTGILLFVSVMERKAILLADESINTKIDTKIWQKIVNEMVSHLKQKNFETAFSQSISECGQLLSEHFPLSKEDRNELSNQLVVLE